MSSFLSYVHNLRGAAILFVVGVHARGGGADWVTHQEAHHYIRSIFDTIEGNGTIMFVFVAGFLFQYLTHNNFNYAGYLGKKFKFIMLPYIIISIPIILIRISSDFQSMALPDGFHDRSVVFQFLYYLVTGVHMAPFWFITMVSIMYLTTPLLHLLDNEKFYKYVFPFVFIAGLFTFRSNNNVNPLLAYLHFLPIYLSGMWVSFNREKILAMSPRLIWLLVVIYFSVTALELSGKLSWQSELTFEHVLFNGVAAFNFYMFRACVLCFAIMLILYELRETPMPFLKLLADYSFGIFFIHFILIALSRKLLTALDVTVDFSLPSFLIYYTFVLCLSVVTVYCVKKIAGRYSRHFIGS